MRYQSTDTTLDCDQIAMASRLRVDLARLFTQSPITRGGPLRGIFDLIEAVDDEFGLPPIAVQPPPKDINSQC